MAVFRPDPARVPASSPPRLWAALLIGLASSVLTGLDSWGDFHLSVYGALGIAFAAAALLARSSPQPIRCSPLALALAGYFGIVGIVEYGGRSDNLSISLDDVRNDGAPGEADNVASDVERVRSGVGHDVLSGSDAPNTLMGGYGDDTLRGAGGEDYVYAGSGNDVLVGGDGQDILQGDNGDDQLDGGPGVDAFNGDGDGTCEVCGSGADRILARDGLSESVRCGAGEDTAILDHNDRIPIEQHCEQIQRASVTDERPKPDAAGATGVVSPPATSHASAPYAKCNKLKGAKRTACVKHVNALKKCSKLKSNNKKKACIRKANALKRCNQLEGTKKQACIRKVDTRGRRA